MTPGDQNSSPTIESIIESTVQSMVRSRVQSPGFAVFPCWRRWKELKIITQFKQFTIISLSRSDSTENYAEVDLEGYSSAELNCTGACMC